VIVEPPSFAGAVKFTVACLSPALTLPITGALAAVGVMVGVTLFDAADDALVPTALLAVTVNV
jgi:hypothetical protein